ncbi:MAG: amidohydrolase family protein [Rhodobacterales bacterium]|nr:amidohydrolase family protein [Rhodobacterales bacterium]
MTESKPLPAGACDCHLHIYEPAYPMAPTALLPPPEAPLAAYRGLRARLGIDRSVIVQPTTYGLDNRCTLAAAAALGEGARAVVTVDRTTTDADLARFNAAGARGARFHMLPGGPVPWDDLAPVAERVADLGWHIQLQMNGNDLPDRLDALKRLPTPLVIDHVGRFHGGTDPSGPAFKALLDLLAGGRCWVKLSAPYEASKADAPRYGDIGALAKRLVAAAPERLVWATNWPHPGQDPAPDDVALLALMDDWVPDPDTRRRIWVDNPAALYGF